ncbi:hypothetical protein OEZ85_003545 [Tetradesmus obliquus]|uniref:Uncharacterized protein n=1 Tax=Tetradesmus obliquus TaxID=3088 RepID=A0ABY8UEU9_TETOB|nr:hypothetical protein OEZ85_003545 [Tetradesmus obliquus]
MSNEQQSSFYQQHHSPFQPDNLSPGTARVDSRDGVHHSSFDGDRGLCAAVHLLHLRSQDQSLWVSQLSAADITPAHPAGFAASGIPFGVAPSSRRRMLGGGRGSGRGTDRGRGRGGFGGRH